MPDSNTQLVENFIERYVVPERKAEMLPNVVVLLNQEQAASVFHLPNSGANVANLKEHQFSILPCLLPGEVTTKLDELGKQVEVL